MIKVRTVNAKKFFLDVGQVSGKICKYCVLTFYLMGQNSTFINIYPAGALWRRLLHRNGTFVPPAPTGRFSGPRGPIWRYHFWYLTQKERCTGKAECNQVTLFPYKYWVFEEKTRFGPVSGHLGPKRVSGNCRKWPKATGRNCVAEPFMHES